MEEAFSRREIDEIISTLLLRTKSSRVDWAPAHYGQRRFRRDPSVHAFITDVGGLTVGIASQDEDHSQPFVLQIRGEAEEGGKISQRISSLDDPALADRLAELYFLAKSGHEGVRSLRANFLSELGIHSFVDRPDD